MNHRSWGYILLAVIVSSFVGGAIRVYFSPLQIRNIITEISEKKQPKFHFEFADARLKLSQGMWPAFGIELTQLQITAKDLCITGSALQMDRLFVPFRIRPLLRGEVKFGRLHGGHLRLHYRPTSCVSESVPPSEQDSVVSLERFFQRRWSKEVINTEKILQAVSFDSLQITRDEASLPPLKIKNFQMDFLPNLEGSQMDFEIEWGEPLIGAAPLGLTKMKANVRADEVQLVGQGNLKEGQFRSKILWSIDRGDVDVSLSTRDLPVSSLLLLVQHWGYFKTTRLQLKNQWLDCDMSVRGRIRTFFQLPVGLHQCRLYGDLGHMKIMTEKLDSLKSGGEIHLQIQDLELKNMISTPVLQNFRTFLPYVGRLTGDLFIRASSEYHFTGFVRNAEIYMARYIDRWRQKVSQMRLQLDGRGDRVSAQVDQFVLSGGGEINGRARAQFLSENEVQFTLAFDRLQFAQNHEPVFLDAGLAGLQISGQGRLQDFQLTDFKGQFYIERARGREWDAERIKIDSEYVENVWHFKARIPRIDILKEFSWINELKKFWLGSTPLETPFSITDGRVEVQWDGQSGAWSEFRAQQNQFKLQSSGSWNLTEGLSGRIEQIGKGGSNESRGGRLELSGTWTSPTITTVETK